MQNGLLRWWNDTSLSLNRRTPLPSALIYACDSGICYSQLDQKQKTKNSTSNQIICIAGCTLKITNLTQYVLVRHGASGTIFFAIQKPAIKDKWTSNLAKHAQIGSPRKSYTISDFYYAAMGTNRRMRWMMPCLGWTILPSVSVNFTNKDMCLCMPPWSLYHSVGTSVVLWSIFSWYRITKNGALWQGCKFRL